MPTWVDFKELRSKLDFEAVLRYYNVQYQRNATRLEAACPLPAHTGKRESLSFSANAERNVFQCFGCKAGGNILEFAALMERVDPEDPAAFRKVALKLQIEFGDGSTPTDAARKAGAKPDSRDFASDRDGRSTVNEPLDFELKELDPKHPYLLGRGFSPETISHFKLGFCSRGHFKDRIAIPLHNQNGELVGYSGRIVDDSAITEDVPKYLFPSSRTRGEKRFEFRRIDLLYNAHRVSRSAKDLVLVQGFPAVWWLHQSGVPQSVALMGSLVSKAQAEIIEWLVAPDGLIWLLTDGNTEGGICGEEATRVLSGRRPVRWLKLTGSRQVTDYTPDELKALLPFTTSASAPGAAQESSVRTSSDARTLIVELANSFPSLSPRRLTAQTWNPHALDDECGAMSSGERCIVQFLLNVWNPAVSWKCGRFNVFEAVSVWDKPHREAFLAWAKKPWWP